MFMEASGECVSTCKFKSPNGELIERICVIASHRLPGKIKNMEQNATRIRRKQKSKKKEKKKRGQKEERERSDD